MLWATSSIWIYNAIIKPIFLHGMIVWWKFSQSENNQKYISRLNRLASLTRSSCFPTTSTAALELLLDIIPLHIVMQSTAMSTCHRLILNNLWESKHVQGHNEIFQSLTYVIQQALMPSDSIPRCLSFGMTNVKFVIPDREQWLEQKVSYYDINIFTDGSRNELGAIKKRLQLNLTIFHNVGSDLANQLPPPLTDYTQYFDSSEIQPIFTLL